MGGSVLGVVLVGRSHLHGDDDPDGEQDEQEGELADDRAGVEAEQRHARTPLLDEQLQLRGEVPADGALLLHLLGDAHGGEEHTEGEERGDSDDDRHHEAVKPDEQADEGGPDAH
ncbi:hypothetical protein SAMN05444392_107116 [Seinonella peptonophila]|uniref:Uncharacterized protein n=1 Tax=Seinonella peptonophila TaxID=112248 RepID=A0A1M4YTI8_9BACL|nr:hypothetical protein SAMN05444392_107116 [Seinonella peptonophila]